MGLAELRGLATEDISGLKYEGKERERGREGGREGKRER